jgi:signal transduction histidine kinase
MKRPNALAILGFALVNLLFFWQFWRQAPNQAAWLSDLASRYTCFWEGLDARSRFLSVKLETMLRSETQDPVALFRALESPELQPRTCLRADISPSTLLLDSNGDAIAWSGPGLYHEPPLEEILGKEVGFRQGAITSTLYTAREVKVEAKRWWLIVGVSVRNDRLPFAVAFPGHGERYFFAESVQLPANDRGGFEMIAGPIQNGPRLVVRPPELVPRELPSIVWVLLGGALLSTPFLLLVTPASGVSKLERWLPRLSPWFSPLAILPLLWTAYRLASLGSTNDLGAALGTLLTVETVWRLALFLAVWLIVATCSRPGRNLGSPAIFLILASVGALMAAALKDEGIVALILIVAAIFFLASSLQTKGRHPLVASLEPWVFLVSALVAAALFQVAERQAIVDKTEALKERILQPPSDTEQNDILTELQSFFENRGLEGVAPVLPPEKLDLKDLGYALWSSSPLSQRKGLSALAIETDSGETVSFAAGLPLGSDGRVLPNFSWIDHGPWSETLLVGEADLSWNHQQWGRVQFWYQPLPGFRRVLPARQDPAGLLDLESGINAQVDGQPTTTYGLFDRAGRPVFSPWPVASPLKTLGVSNDRSLEETPEGRSWAFRVPLQEGIGVLFLPSYRAITNLEQVGVQSLLTLCVLAFWLIAFLIAGNPRHLIETIRAGWESMSLSYSRKIVAIFSVWLVVPLIALNILFLHSFDLRLRADRIESAQDAMNSVKSLLLDYLKGLEAGFLIETKVNQELMHWISRLVRHQVNLYWGSQIYSSSQKELMAAGLLPERIPAEVFVAIALENRELAYRETGSKSSRYLEIYSPLNFAGLAPVQRSLFLSVPLLEQEKRIVDQLRSMRTRALLVSTLLILTLIWIGNRLASHLTHPILELIGQTEQIAEGKPVSLRPLPKVSELSALAEAVDLMAIKITENQNQLRSEKEFIQRVVDNISSAVLLLGADARILFQNQIAEKWLGSKVGDSIADLTTAHLAAPLFDLALQGLSTHKPLNRRLQLHASEEARAVDWELIWIPFAGVPPQGLLLIADISDALRAQRLETFVEMASIVAHEVKNPLTPIRLTAEHLRQVYRESSEISSQLLEQCIANILRQVDALQEIASEFSLVSKIPQAIFTLEKLAPLLQENVEAYVLDPDGPQIELDLQDPSI